MGLVGWPAWLQYAHCSTRPARSRARITAFEKSQYARAIARRTGSATRLLYECHETSRHTRIAAHSGPRARVLSSATAPDIAAGLVAGTL